MMGCKKYRIGVFFDGTGNNKFIEANRGEGGATNIAKLYKLYEELKGKECGTKKCYSDKVYIEGIGTHTKVKNNKRVKDRHSWDEKIEKGAGGGGGERIDEAIKKVVALLKSHPHGKGDPNKFCERTIDVFGFSRGAAQARDFINTFYKKNKNRKGYNFGFIGIYDTVGSFGSSGDNINMKPLDPSKHNESDGVSFDNHINTIDKSTQEFLGNFTDHNKASAFARQERAKLDDTWKVEVIYVGGYGLHSAYRVKKARKAFTKYNFDLADGSAKRIFHIVSNDEVRKNFPLSSLLSISGKHQEAGFPGVHADVGGGYDNEVVEPHSYSPIGAYYGKEKARKAALVEKAKLSEGWEVNIRSFDKGYYGIRCTLARNVTNSISRVTLHHMYNEGTKAQVPFKPMPNDEAHQIAFEMKAYYDLYDKNKSIFIKSNSHDVKKFGELTKKVNWNELDGYRHHSSVDPKEASTHYDGDTSISHVFTKDSPDLIGGNNARYVDGKVERDIYPNNWRNAIVPKNT